MIIGMDAGVGELHLAICRRFGSAVRTADGNWDRRSPCAAWHARDVLEHVIGFHDVLILRPLGLKPDRPHDDPQRRWDLTYKQLEVALHQSDLFDRVVASNLVPRLTQDVLVHTWDLARAVGSDDTLNPLWCQHFLEQLPHDLAALSASGMFAPPVVIDDQATAQKKLLARLGRNPSWWPET